MTGMTPGVEPNVKKLFLLIAAATFATSASAEFIDPTPSSVCSLLSDSGLKGRKWVDDYGDGSSGCASDYKDIGSTTGFANNLAFYATGVGQYVMEMKLVLNYHQPSQPGAATKALLSASNKLAQRALGARLPESVEALIRQGKHGSSKVGKGVVEIVRDDWPTGKGYEVQVIMR